MVPFMHAVHSSYGRMQGRISLTQLIAFDPIHG